MPSSPYTFCPQPYILLSVININVALLEHIIFNGIFPVLFGIKVKVFLSVVSPSPNCPLEFCPVPYIVPSLIKIIVKLCPRLIDIGVVVFGVVICVKLYIIDVLPVPN